MAVPGSTLPAVRARLLVLIGDRLSDVAVTYHPGARHLDPASGASGPAEAVFLVGNTQAGATVRPAALGTPVLSDEEWTQTVVVQVLGRDTGDRQEDLDERCGQLLGEIVDEIATTPRLGLDVEGWGAPTVTVAGWRWLAGVLQRGSGTLTENARVEVDLSVRASRC